MQVLNDGLDQEQIARQRSPSQGQTSRNNLDENDIELLQDDEKLQLRLEEEKKQGTKRELDDSRNSDNYESQLQTRLKENMV